MDFEQFENNPQNNHNTYALPGASFEGLGAVAPSPFQMKGKRKKRKKTEKRKKREKREKKERKKEGN